MLCGNNFFAKTNIDNETNLTNCDYRNIPRSSKTPQNSRFILTRTQTAFNILLKQQSQTDKSFHRQLFKALGPILSTQLKQCCHRKQSKEMERTMSVSNVASSHLPLLLLTTKMTMKDLIDQLSLPQIEQTTQHFSSTPLLLRTFSPWSQPSSVTASAPRVRCGPTSPVTVIHTPNHNHHVPPWLWTLRRIFVVR